jgi:uncharacterized repeat protein (TIGR04076 family)
MSNGYDLKITVLKRFDPAEVFEKSPVTSEQPMKACDVFKDSQEFFVPGHDLKVPDGFCSAAWVSIFPFIMSLSSGGETWYLKEKNVAIGACIDGLRPVIFKIERI